jgi:ferredoxin
VPTVRILNRKASFDVQHGRTVLTGAQKSNARWRSYCGGKALCGTCCMLVVDGELDAPSDVERYFIEGWGYHPGYRLACQARVTGDVSVISCGDEGYEKERVLRAFAACSAKPTE